MAGQGAVVLPFARVTGGESMAQNVAVAPTAGPTPDAISRVHEGAATYSRTKQLVTIQSLRNGVVFVHPLYASVDRIGDEWFAISNDVALVGRGESELEAVDDLRAELADLFESLSEMRSELGPLMRDQLGLLERLAGLK